MFILLLDYFLSIKGLDVINYKDRKGSNKNESDGADETGYFELD